MIKVTLSLEMISNISLQSPHRQTQRHGTLLSWMLLVQGILLYLEKVELLKRNWQYVLPWMPVRIINNMNAIYCCIHYSAWHRLCIKHMWLLLWWWREYILFILLSCEVLKDTLGLKVSVILISFYLFTHLFIHLSHMYWLPTKC